MGDRPGVVAADVTSASREVLALRALRRGSYLVEIGRAEARTAGNANAAPAAPTAPAAPIRGTLEITALAARRALPFELIGDRVVVGRVAVSLEERLEELGPGAPGRVAIGAIAHPRVRQIVLARFVDLRQCYAAHLVGAPGLAGTVSLAVQIDHTGGTRTRTAQPAALAGVAACMRDALASMHVEGSPAQTVRFDVTVRP